MKRLKVVISLLMCTLMFAATYNPLQVKADAPVYYISYEELCKEDACIDLFYEPGDSSDLVRYFYVEITDLKKVPKYNYKTFKSSNKKVCSLYRVGWERSYSKDGTYMYYFAFEAVKTGTSKVTFQLGKKSYSLTVNVSSKKNDPIKSITLNGVNNGKNLKSKLEKVNKGALVVKTKKDIKNLKLNIKPKKDWVVTSISVSVEKKDTSPGKRKGSFRISTPDLLTDKKYKEIRQLSIGSFKKKDKARVIVVFRNTKTHSIEDIIFYINEAL